MKKFILLGMALACAIRSLAQLSISLPVAGVYQSTSTNTSVVLAGQYIGSSLSNYRIEYEVYRLDVSDSHYLSTQQTWTTITTNPTYGLFRTTLSLPIGWYSVAVRVWNISTSSAGSSNSVVFGVGDVFVISGQSNAQGGSSSLPSLNTTYDGIVSHNYTDGCNNNLPPYPVMTALSTYNSIGPNGTNSWCWAYLGQQLQSGAPSGGKPIAFFNAAHGGSSSLNWKESANGTNTTNQYTGSVWCGGSYSGPAQPYFSLKTTLQYYAAIFGVNALLWHQGEADNEYPSGRTNRSTYRQNLLDLIAQTRTDYGSSLRWLVSEASFQGANPTGYETNTDVTSAQDDIVSNSSYDPSDYNYKGVITDGYGTSYRDITDKVHFREDRNNAVSLLGNLWNTAIGNATSGPIGGVTPPTITMSKVGSNWTLTCQGTYSAYRWINMSSANTNSPVGTSFSYSGSTGGSYACLVQSSNGKWAISQTIYTNCGSCREGAFANWSEEEEGIQTKAYPVPFDKDLTIEFTIPADSRVRLELIDESGRILQKVTDSMHIKGTFKYPISLDSSPSSILFYRLNVNGLGITKKLLKVQ
ncbi:T9SS type A sorting domain-containing protein [Nibrella viscosa]